jgi:SAM-dependent methyltransferase
MIHQPDEVDREDVESLLLMSRVHLAASRQGSDGSVAADVLSAVAAQTHTAGSALGDAQRARELLEQQNVVGSTRFPLPKRMVLRLSRLFTHRLVAAGQALTDAVECSIQDQNQAMIRDHNETQDDLERLGNSLKAQMVSVEIASQNALDSLASSVLDSHQVSVSSTASAVSGFESTVSLVEGRIAGLERDREQGRREIQRLRAMVSKRNVGPRPASDAGTGGTEPADSAGLDDPTYVEFERRFRGSPKEIKERQLDALRFVESIVGSPAPLLDLGCGRGEWLGVLRDAGISAYGVDTNAGMVADALALELDARCDDALTHMENLGESSLQAVSAFHFAEHVPLPFLTRVLDAALLALCPGGILLIETPNPTNLVVGSAAFYLDPTHLRPLHPDFLAFLVESRGFVDVEVHFVHPVIDEALLRAGDPDEGYDPRLSRVVESAEWALFGPQDYVVVARRPEAVV